MANIRQNHKSFNRSKGVDGEDVACKFLVNKGFSIVMRNYRKAWGEIDIIAERDKFLHFIEVKSVTFHNAIDMYFDAHKPEENVHNLKIRRIRRMIETYMDEYNIGLEREFQFHVLCVYLNMETRKAKVKMIENIIL